MQGRGRAPITGSAGWTTVVIVLDKVHMKGATNMMKIDWIGSEECKLYLKSDAP